MVPANPPLAVSKKILLTFSYLSLTLINPHGSMPLSLLLSNQIKDV